MSYINTSTISGNTTEFSQANSFREPMAANQVWVGEFEDVRNFAQISIVVFSDQVGTMLLEYSFDGVSVDRAITFPVTLINSGILATAGPRGPYFRLSYTNGPTPTTQFHVNSFYSPTILAQSTSPIANGLSGTSNGMISKSVLFGIKQDGTYTQIACTNQGYLMVSDPDDNGGGGGGGTTVVGSPKFTPVLVPGVAAGSQATLQSIAITPNKTGYLNMISVTCNSPFKANVVMVNQDIESATIAYRYSSDLSWDFTPPNASFFSVASGTSGFCGYRVYVTNLDVSDAADVQVTFYYTEQ